MPYPTPQFAPLTIDTLLLSRKSAARLGKATKDIVERGWYSMGEKYAIYGVHFARACAHRHAPRPPCPIPYGGV
jgi:hypothetical protein